MRVAWADPPYPEQAESYGELEVDHAELLKHLDDGYDGWLLNTSSTGLRYVLRCADQVEVDGFRIMAWLKPFSAFKKNVSVAYAWEPVLVKAARKPTVSKRTVMRHVSTGDEPIIFRDICAESITLKKGTRGAKPENLCRWGFEMLGLEPTDHLVDLYPGSGAVLAAWNEWRAEIAARGSRGRRLMAGAKCERCGLRYEMGKFGPATNEPYTCDDCGGYVDEDEGDA